MKLTKLKNKCKILMCFGTRPEAIKLAPVISALKKDLHFNVKICVTAQHREMLDQVLDIFNIHPDYDLNIMVSGQTLFSVTRNVIQGMENILNREKPDLVIIQGDTTSAFVTGLCAFYKKIGIVHIEAGLRTYDKYQPFPEEINRRLISHITDINFAPTQQSKKQLVRESVRGNIFVTGNTIVDALSIIQRRRRRKLPFSIKKNRKIILLTVHRRENFGEPLQEIFSAFQVIASNYKDIEIIYPVHPNPNVSTIAYSKLSSFENIRLIPPLDYISFIKLMARSYIIVTDSGGLQEEAPTFKKPVLILRNKTERPEALKYKTAKLIGTRSAKIVNEVRKLLEIQSEYDRYIPESNPFGDGKAADRIKAYLKYYAGFTRKIPRSFT